jgi:4-amino-4-deoxy-L-arabinose transferase-like glycosyltransferase
MLPSVRRFPYSQSAVGVALAAAFLLAGLQRVNQERDLNPMDTAAYLDEAHFIAEHGGPLRLVPLLLTGAYRYDNRQPLYPWLLSFVAVRDLAFLPRAKLVSLAAGFVCFLLTLWMARRFADDLTALLVGLLLLANATFIGHSAIVACESTLVVLVVGWWGATAVALDRPRWWPPAGALAGLAYLAKASGLLLLATAVLTALIVGVRKRVWKNGWFWLSFAGFLLVTWPLLARNVSLWGNPFHNWNSSAMWADRWEDTYRPAFAAHPPGPIDYLRTHSAGAVFGRLGAGLAGQARMLFEALDVLHLPAFVLVQFVAVDIFRVTALEGNLPPWVSGVIVLPLAALGVWSDRRRARSALTLVTLLTFFLVFAWYHQVVQGPRFILPLAPIIFFYAARGTLHLVGLRKRHAHLPATNAGSRLVPLVALGLLGLSLLFLAVLPVGDPLASYDVPPGYEALRDWIRTHVGRDEPYALGPTHVFLFEPYSADFPRGRQSLPALNSPAELKAWLADRRIRTLIVDTETCVRNQTVFRPSISFDSAHGLRLLTPIPNWHLVERDANTPCLYLVFRSSLP